MTGQLESTLVLAVRDTIRWESAVDAPSQGTLTPLDPNLPFNPLTYQQRDRELADRDIVVGAALADTSIQISNVYNYPAIKPQLEGPMVKDLPFDADEITEAGTASLVRHVKNSSIPWDAARYTDSDLYGRDALVYEVLARACQTAFINPPISRIDSAGTVFSGISAWSLAEGQVVVADINPALPLNRDLFKLPDQNLADRDTALATYAANLAQVLKNPFAHALRIYVKVDGPTTTYREAEVYVLTSDNGINRIWQAEPALSNRNRIIYSIANKTLQWIRESVNSIHVPQIYAITIPGIDAGQLLTTLPEVPEKKDAQFWRLKAGLVIPAGEQITDTSAFLRFTATDSAAGGTTQADSASLTAPGQLALSMSGVLQPANYRVSVLTVPCPTVEIAGAQNSTKTSGILGGATFEINVPSGSITSKQYLVENGDGIVYSGQTYAAGDIFSGVSGTSTYTQVGSLASSVRQYAINFQLALTPGPWRATVAYTDLSGLSTGFGIKAQYAANGANTVNVIQDIVPEPFNGMPGTVVETVTAGFDVDNTGAFSFPIFWTYGTGQLHVRKIIFESDSTTGHYEVQGQFGSNALSYVDVTGTAFQPDVMRFEFNATNPINLLAFNANWTAEAQMPIKFKQIQIQTIGTYTPTPVADEFFGWRQECVDRAERVIQQDYVSAVAAFGTNLPTFRDSGSKWSPDATENWMSFVETMHPRLREVPDIDNTLGIVDGRQYEVVSGPVIYGVNTYAVGETFYGSADIDTAYYGGNVKQVGAFIKALPGHIGKHALIPYGLAYSGNGTVTAYYDTDKSIPMIASCVPWMIDQGVYVAQSEFWTPDYIIEAQSAVQSKVLIAQAEATATGTGTTPGPYNCQGNPSNIDNLTWLGGPYSSGVAISGAGTTITGALTSILGWVHLSGSITTTLCNPTNSDISVLFTFSGSVTNTPPPGFGSPSIERVLISSDNLVTNKVIAYASYDAVNSTPSTLSAPALSLTTFTVNFDINKSDAEHVTTLVGQVILST